MSKKHFENYVEINLANDKAGDGLFPDVRTTESFYIELSVFAGEKLKSRENNILPNLLRDVFINIERAQPLEFTVFVSFLTKKTLWFRNQESGIPMVPEAGLEPARPHQTLDFESNASTIPPFGLVAFAFAKAYAL